MPYDRFGRSNEIVNHLRNVPDPIGARDAVNLSTLRREMSSCTHRNNDEKAVVENLQSTFFMLEPKNGEIDFRGMVLKNVGLPKTNTDAISHHFLLTNCLTKNHISSSSTSSPYDCKYERIKNVGKPREIHDAVDLGTLKSELNKLRAEFTTQK